MHQATQSSRMQAGSCVHGKWLKDTSEQQPAWTAEVKPSSCQGGNCFCFCSSHLVTCQDVSMAMPQTSLALLCRRPWTQGSRGSCLPLSRW